MAPFGVLRLRGQLKNGKVWINFTKFFKQKIIKKVVSIRQKVNTTNTPKNQGPKKEHKVVVVA